MNTISLLKSIRILYIPPYYEHHFELAVDRLTIHDKHIDYQVFTIDKKYIITNDLNLLLSMCRTIIQEEHIQMLIADSHIGQLIVAKLCQEYPQLYNRGMNFLSTLQCINRYLMINLFGVNKCVPTLFNDTAEDQKINFENMQIFLPDNKINGYVKSLYGFNNQLSSFYFSTWEMYSETINTYIKLYKEQHLTKLLSLFRIYTSIEQYPLIFKSSYLIQPFFDLTTYPHWRLVIANACVFDKEIIMWPLVDGYSGWPFLAEKPLAIMPIIVCPSRQLTVEQQNKIYIYFRQHLNYLIENHHLHYGWIECSYFISCTNEIRLISIKPTYSVYLTEAFNSINQHGNPIIALVQLSNHQRPQTPILNGKTVYIHRLYTNVQEKYCINDLINMKEVKRIHRSNSCMNYYVRLRFQEDDIITNDNKQIYTELGFIQVNGDYYEIGLRNLIEFRYILLKKPELIPFSHPSMLINNPYQFDSITCLPSKQLLEQLENIRKQEQKDLI
ncbi:unnamed protein product [Adineta steineri]|uniref:Uncharacterized protein n=1 Tax=Adineta steineri TaxID=433720 RepID=A0A813Y594_9BILA|nr:unnamed protein product [Adineta steineri]CAF3512227.1 unnamed protein product [Adineta steineri]